jgi:hypothetical protein
MRRRPATLGLLILALAAVAFVWLRSNARDSDGTTGSGRASGTQGPPADRPLLAAGKGRQHGEPTDPKAAETTTPGTTATVPLRIVVS